MVSYVRIITSAAARRFAVAGTCLALAAAFSVADQGFVSTARADETKATTVRPEVGKPIQAAQELVKAKKFKDALAKVREAEAIGSRTPYENYIVEITKGQAAAQSGDPATAAAAFEAAAAVAPSGKVQLIAAAAGQSYLAKSYAKAAALAERYEAEGGNDPTIRTMHVQALYLAGNYGAAQKELAGDVKEAESKGQAVPEQTLQLLADIANKQKDSAGYRAAIENLVSHYPKREYWASLIYSVQTRQGLSDRLALDILRTKLATDNVRETEEYVDAAQLALQAGFPIEAKKFVDAGYAAKKLGDGAEASRHARLRDAAVKALAADEKSLGQDDAKVAQAATGEPLLNTGFNYVLRGQTDKGLDMMEQAMTKNAFKRPDEAALHYGMALVMGGQKTKALRVLEGVGGKDGTAEIARLWKLLALK